MIKKSLLALVSIVLIIPIFNVYAMNSNDHHYTPPDNDDTNSLLTNVGGPFEIAIYGEIDQLEEKIQESIDDDWRNPASNRKKAINNKLEALKDLISSNNYEEAYDKLLHDIKPKLTGLKTDEEENPWENGVFNNPWVISNDLNEEYRLDCNMILILIATTSPDNGGVIEPA